MYHLTTRLSNGKSRTVWGTSLNSIKKKKKNSITQTRGQSKETFRPQHNYQEISGDAWKAHKNLSHLFATHFPQTSLTFPAVILWLVNGTSLLRSFSICYGFDVHEFTFLNLLIVSASMILCVNKLHIFISLHVAYFPWFKPKFSIFGGWVTALQWFSLDYPASTGHFQLPPLILDCSVKKAASLCLL